MFAPGMTSRASVQGDGIWWIRRDLRVADNKVLRMAAQSCQRVCPVYVVSPWRGNHLWTGPNRQQFLCGCLASLDRKLAKLGGRMVVRRGDPVAQLERVILETGASALYFQKDPDPYGKVVEQAVAVMAERLGVKVHPVHDVTLHDPDAVLTGAGLPYRVYTPYWNNWHTQPKEPPVPTLQTLASPQGLASDPLPTLATWGLPAASATLVEAGEDAARKRFEQALQQRLAAYAEHRDFPALDGTSRISQDLRMGLISIRTVVAMVEEARAAAAPRAEKGLTVFLKELAWREFYFAILHHFPEVLELEFAPQWRGLPWDEPGAEFEAWCQGRTGFPIVDAGMRELLATGHMHNRLRMITAMFLTKDLHHDWRLGESWFMRHLVDGEIASNNGGWQWSAGTGADAAPYFRIQNPWSQTARYDPGGSYIKRWVPELAEVPPAAFLKPPAAGRPIAPGYPLPVVDHDHERQRTLDRFKRHKV